MSAKRKQSTVSGKCERCNRHYFETRQSGGKVKYCPDCRKINEREKAAERARRYRQRQADLKSLAGVKDKPKHGAGYNPKKRGWPHEFDRSIDGKRYRLQARKRGGVSTETPNGKRGN